jgi:hypothetical protein
MGMADAWEGFDLSCSQAEGSSWTLDLNDTLLRIRCLFKILLCVCRSPEATLEVFAVRRALRGSGLSMSLVNGWERWESSAEAAVGRAPGLRRRGGGQALACAEATLTTLNEAGATRQQLAPAPTQHARTWPIAAAFTAPVALNATRRQRAMRTTTAIIALSRVSNVQRMAAATAVDVGRPVCTRGGDQSLKRSVPSWQPAPGR